MDKMALVGQGKEKRETSLRTSPVGGVYVTRTRDPLRDRQVF